MDVKEAARCRHSVRQYEDRKIEEELREILQKEVQWCNGQADLHIQLMTEEPEAFTGFLPHYGSFRNVRNYFALIGKEGAETEEKLGYYGQHLVLRAQQLGLNTCWVKLTFNRRKSKCRVAPGERLFCVIALGYGQNQGIAHRSKSVEKLGKSDVPMPDWFKAGMEMAALAPTALNRQNFLISLEKGRLYAKITGGLNSAMDLGIVKYHFALGAGPEKAVWG